MTSPGFCVVTHVRLAHYLNKRQSWFLRRLSTLVWHHTVKAYGCYIAREAAIGAGLELPHPVGIVIGEASIIGANVVIFQNVTLGRAQKSSSSCPTIGDGAMIYAGATLLGGIKVGKGAIVGAHSVVISDVPDGATVVGSPARIVQYEGLSDP